ncbi:MAG TPA: pyruvate kinase [Sedimenticola sp.]|nr:pyruvate kinase [Sedimenticola sp.]
MLRRTKIVATLGPATDDPGVLDELIDAGLDVARINLSHGPREVHARRIRILRERTAAKQRPVGLLVDLQGPKIRIGRFAGGAVTLADGDAFALDAACPLEAGDGGRVGLTFPQLIEDLSTGDILLLDDGRIVLRVDALGEGRADCTVVMGGRLSDSKGINRQGGGLSATALSAKDREDIGFAAEMEADYLAVSFVRDASDVEQARELLREARGQGGILAKIERAEALASIEDIIAASDAIMVARGDLGVEIGDAELPAVQKSLIRRAREMDTVVITATQMMESMIENAIPTRAEVFDVANAVFDGTDAVMLSAETAMGRNPAKSVAAMDRICREAEKHKAVRTSSHRIDSVFTRRDEAIAMAAMYTANHYLRVKAIAALTESGSTVKTMSRISSGIPIYAMTRHRSTRRKVTLFRGVYPIRFDVVTTDARRINQAIIDELLRRHAVEEGDVVIITKGDRSGVGGRTNTMKIMRVGDHVIPPQA